MSLLWKRLLIMLDLKENLIGLNEKPLLEEIVVKGLKITSFAYAWEICLTNCIVKIYVKER